MVLKILALWMGGGGGGGGGEGGGSSFEGGARAKVPVYIGVQYP